MAGTDILEAAHAGDKLVQHVTIDGAGFTALWGRGSWLLVPTFKSIAVKPIVRVTPEQLEAWRD